MKGSAIFTEGGMKMSMPDGKSVALAVVALCAVFASSAEIATREAQINPPDSNAIRTEANSSVVKEVRMEAQFVVCGGGVARQVRNRPVAIAAREDCGTSGHA